GAAVNVITNGIREELNLKIEEGSKVRCVMANGDKIGSLGVTTINLAFGNEDIPIRVEIIESDKDEIILGNGILKELQANIDFKEDTVTLWKDETFLEIPVRFTKGIISK